jgi:peptidoglycan/LPS O-acetylase OafA/YrhL
MALPVLIALAGAVSFRPAMLRSAPVLPIGLLLLFAAWAGLSSLWSPYPDHTQAPKLIATVLLGLMFAAGVSANAEARRRALACALQRWR